MREVVGSIPTGPPLLGSWSSGMILALGTRFGLQCEEIFQIRCVPLLVAKSTVRTVREFVPRHCTNRPVY